MDGLIILDKSLGVSSQGAVTAVKRLLHEKAGHCGTLDPLATGVLPVCLGRATRLSEYVMGRAKVYQAEVTFGRETDSYDRGGEILSAAGAAGLTRGQVEAALPAFLGDIWQRPPVISALKQGGVALYKKARRGETVETPARPVHIYSIELTNFQPGDFPIARLTVGCGQGAYIRSLAHDLGAALGCGAYLTGLRRTQVGPFGIEQALAIEQLTQLVQAGDESFLISMEQALAHLPLYVPEEEQLSALAHGNQAAAAPGPDGPLRVQAADGRLLGVGHISPEEALSMDKVLTEAEAFDQQRFTVAALGTFDGLHLGHRELFRQAAELKRQLGGDSAAVTFDVHPLSLIAGATPPPLLTSAKVRRELLRRFLAVDGVVTLTFDEGLRDSTPRQFVENVLLPLGVRQVVVGYNYTFAIRGSGNVEILRQLCAEHDVAVRVVEEVDGPWGPVSASNIRRHIAEGDMEAANAMLGYWLTLDATRQADGGYSPDQPGQALPPAGLYTARLPEQDCLVTVAGEEGRRLYITPLGDTPPERRTRLYIGPACGSRQQGEEILSRVGENKHLPKFIR